MELVMFVGIPASGKSTRSAHYKEAGYMILSSDQIRAELMHGAGQEGLTDEQRRAINSQVFEIIRIRAQQSLKQGQSVVVDATNLSRKRRMNFLKQMTSLPCRKKCELFLAPVEVCLERNRHRTGIARVPEEEVRRMLCSFECPNLWEGFDEIHPVVSGESYSFPFDRVQAFPQDNPHHRLTLGGHMNAAEEYCVANGFGPMLERVARYHDIGKLYTKRFCNFRGKPTPDAHYMGHENYSSYLYLTEMCCGKELSPEQFRQVLYEACLIGCHMRPLVHWQNKSTAKDKDIALFGAEFIDDLTKLNLADRAAH